MVFAWAYLCLCVCVFGAGRGPNMTSSWGAEVKTRYSLAMHWAQWCILRAFSAGLWAQVAQCQTRPSSDPPVTQGWTLQPAAQPSRLAVIVINECYCKFLRQNIILNSRAIQHFWSSGRGLYCAILHNFPLVQILLSLRAPQSWLHSSY